MRALILFLSSLFLAAPAAAQTNVAAFGDWVMQCTAIGVGQTSCGLNQRVSTQSGQLLADVTLSRSGVRGQAAALLVVETQQAVMLNIQPVYQVDGEGPQTALAWQTCLEGICRAAVLINAQHEQALRAGGRMLFAYRQLGADSAIGIPVSLKGVTAGLNALPSQ